MTTHTTGTAQNCSTCDMIDAEGVDMARTKTEAFRAAQKRYAEKSTVFYGLKLCRETDADLIAKLESVGNKQGYIKGLIRRDLEK